MALNKRKGNATLTAAQTLDIRPPVGEEWTLHNIYYGASTYNGTIGIDVVIVDGATSTYINRDTTQGAMLGVNLNLTNDHYVRLINYTAGNAFNVSYDGVLTGTT